MDGREARAALADMGAARSRLVTTTGYPAWRHAAFGAVMALLVGGIGISNKVSLVATGVGLVATYFLAQHDRKTSGMFVNGFRAGRTFWVTTVLMLAMLALMFGQVRVRFSVGPGLWTAVIAAAAFAVGTAASIVWWRAYVADLTRGRP